MERRDFLKLCSMTGLAVVAGAATSSKRAEAAPAHSLFISVHAGGGPDVTSFCDPKGAGSAAEVAAPAPKDTMNNYLTSAIPQLGNIRWAPMDQTPSGLQNTVDSAAWPAFFNAHWQDLLVINGIDMMTNSHEVGTRAIWSGNLAENTPTVSALIAAALAPGAPLGYVSFGGYDVTAGVAPATRLGSIQAIKKLAFPYRRDPDDENSNFLSDETQAKIAAAREARYKLKSQNQRLPLVKNAMSTLYLSRLGQNELKQLVAYLPEDLENGIAGGAQLAIAAFKAGLCAAVSLDVGGFDTHGNNDAGVIQSGADLLNGVTRIRQLAEQAGVWDRTAIFISGDFGRTPGYNDGNGKDHWAVSSMMVMGHVNGRKIAGNRVVGQTDAGHNPIPLDPNSMQPGGSVRISPGHVQNAIRKVYGITDSEASRLFPSGAPTTEFSDLIALE